MEIDKITDIQEAFVIVGGSVPARAYNFILFYKDPTALHRQGPCEHHDAESRRINGAGGEMHTQRCGRLKACLKDALGAILG